MMYTTLLLAAATATASAQVVYNSTTGKFICPADKPDGAFCASSEGDGSLKTNIIIRCTAGFGQPGNCNDNLAGYFPFGVNYAPCWQTSITTGDAACSKNCIVQGGSGKANGTFTLPNCTPVPSPSSSSSTASSTGYPTSGSTTVSSSSTSSGYPTSSSTSTIYTSTSTSTYCPPTTTSTYIYPTGGSTTPSNTTVTTYTTSGVKTSATATPVGPSGTTTAAPSTYTGAATANTAGAGLSLAAIGIFAAYFL